jgi:hypothetical protein
MAIPNWPADVWGDYQAHVRSELYGPAMAGGVFSGDPLEFWERDSAMRERVRPIIALPPKCPELNPVENIWQFLRDNWLSNRVFKSYDDLVDHCCAAWNKLVDQPWRIMSIGLRSWAHGF